jgi:hypothetical protein
MFVKKNKKNRTWFVGHRSPKNVNVFYSVPFKKAKKKSQLTIKLGDKRIDLDGRQVALLKKVLGKGTEAKTWRVKKNTIK